MRRLMIPALGIGLLMVATKAILTTTELPFVY
jgi:hypothetical protein